MRTEREILAALARLEDENRSVRAELDLVLSSKARRLVLAISHPLWALRAAASVALGWKPLATARELWRDFQFHRVSLSSLALPAESNVLETQPAVHWAPELRISGDLHEGLVCPAGSVFTFQAAVGPGASLRAYCAMLPRAWDVYPETLEFRASLRIQSPTETREQTASRILNPLTRWNDRRWRRVAVAMPATVSGDAVVTLETRAPARAGRADAHAVWGDLTLEWPRSREERKRLVLGAIRRFRLSGASGAVTYARGRRRLDDQAVAYTRWVGLNSLDERALADLRAEVATLPYRPLISVITPVHDTPPQTLAACVESVRRQAYENWQLCIADDASTGKGTRETLRKYAADPHLHLTTLETNVHVSAASNAALALATGEYVALLDHDDELAPEALAEVVRFLNVHPDADVVYSDEDKLDEAGVRCEPYFKPDWSPDLFLSYMYTCHLMVVRRQLVEEVGGFRVGFEGAQDYDLLLRLMEKTTRIHHIPKILYHWRKGAGSTASLGAFKPWALTAGRRALEDHARRTGSAAEILDGPHPGMYRFRRAVRGEPLVSIVIPTIGGPSAAGGDVLARCLASLGKTTWRNVEVIVAADREEMSAASRDALRRLRHSVISYEPRTPFNFSHKINEAVRQTAGEHVVLLNDDIEVITPDWLSAMLEYSQEPGVGAVGAKLLYPDGRLQHAGMLVGVCGVSAHAFHRSPGESPGYFGSTISARNCSAVTAACLMTRRAVFDEVGGLDEDLPVDFNDVDFCLRLRTAGYRIVYTPYAQLFHHESASFGRRTQSAQELARMRQRWGGALEQDPYYNPSLSKLFSDYRLQV